VQRRSSVQAVVCRYNGGKVYPTKTITIG